MHSRVQRTPCDCDRSLLKKGSCLASSASSRMHVGWCMSQRAEERLMLLHDPRQAAAAADLLLRAPRHAVRQQDEACRPRRRRRPVLAGRDTSHAINRQTDYSRRDAKRPTARWQATGTMRLTTTQRHQRAMLRRSSTRRAWMRCRGTTWTSCRRRPPIHRGGLPRLRRCVALRVNSVAFVCCINGCRRRTLRGRTCTQHSRSR